MGASLLVNGPAGSTFSVALDSYRRGLLHDARRGCVEALRDQPDRPDALHLLGLTLLRLGDAGRAAEALGRASRLDPAKAAYHCDFGHALALAGELPAAVEQFSRALRLEPGLTPARVNLANALRQSGRPGEAVELCRRALADGPASPEVHNCLGVALQELGSVGEADRHFRRAVALRPDFAEAWVNHAFLLLLKGDFAAGWEAYAWRRRAAPDPSIRPFPQPQWDGSDPPGATVLLRAEQGFGDTIHFVRYAAMVAARGATVMLECHPPLKSLLGRAAGVTRAFGRGEDLPPFDRQAFLLDLPRAFGTRLDSVPAPGAYVSAPPERAEWMGRALAGVRRPIVGLVWAGNPRQANDRNRSCGLVAMAPLLEVEGVTFVGLQVGPAAEELGQCGAGKVLRPPPLEDFADTAAVLSHLDLLVSVDTAAAHLAGAMGRPVWLAACEPPDWRWLEGRTDSPWYPTMRLFRQPSPGDWRSVFTAMAAGLRERIARPPGLTPPLASP